MTSLTLLQRKLRRAVLGRRRLLAGVLAAVAVAASLRVVAGPPPPTAVVLTAARDLTSGTTVRRSDVQESTFLPESVPTGTLDLEEIVGRTTAGPLRAGEPVTDVGLVRASVLDGYPGLVAAPVRVGDADVVSLLRVGDRIDLVAADPQGLRASVVAEGVPVLALP
ncbi:MAG TPA: SAF domain-containing protein, partial [Nocardioidaceae bacterium]|nr:SAF domain-containing protein [Nocardioidaceae bacterium]